MNRAVLLVTLVHLAIFASCRVIGNEDDGLTGSFSKEDEETSRDSDVKDRPISECRIARKGFVVNATQKVTWFGAYIFCRDQEMELAVIGNAEEYQLLVEELKELEARNSVKDDGVWTSGYYDTEEERYQWMTRLTPMNYTVWRPGRPGTSDNRHNCVELRKYDQYKMNDVSCLAENFVACQKQEFSWGPCGSQ